VRTAFRVYEAPDGTKGYVTYVKFDSLQTAEEPTENRVKVTPRVTSREQNQIDEKNQGISDRILGVQDLAESHTQEFVTIRRDALTCYPIESVSLQVAKEIAGLIGYR
jgi:hypothetical protein